MGYIMVMTTTDSFEVAEHMAKALVERRAAACVQVIPAVKSFYEWKGKIECSSEILILIKTREELYGKVESIIRELHNYEVPEIVAVEINRGLRAYLDWIDSVCRLDN